jgi:hypothetical protein
MIEADARLLKRHVVHEDRVLKLIPAGLDHIERFADLEPPDEDGLVGSQQLQLLANGSRSEIFGEFSGGNAAVEPVAAYLRALKDV